MDSRHEENCVENPDRQQKVQIQELNDRFRRERKGGLVCITNGVRVLGRERFEALLQAIAEFDEFTKDNDPHGEHDFGELEFDGKRYFWKIDYYDTSRTYGSPDPADPSLTSRILTVMRASEY